MDDRFTSNSAPVQQGEMVEDYPYRPQPAVIVLRDPGENRDYAPPQLLRAEEIAPYIAAICLGVFFSLTNLAVCPIMAVVGNPSNAGLLVFIAFGAILAEAGLLSTALVLFSGQFWVRAAVCWGMGLFLWACWAIGLSIATWMDSWGDSKEPLQLATLSLPLVSLAIQSPLWFVRCYSGWRLANNKINTSAACPLSIRDYFVGTTVVAVSIAFARLARPASWSAEDYWPGWSIAFICFTGGSLLAILPALLLIFRFPKGWFGLGLLLLYGVIAGAAIVATIETASPGSFSTGEAIQVAAIFVSLAAFLGAGLILARTCGFVLQIAKESRQSL